jgi:hypothetical protein
MASDGIDIRLGVDPSVAIECVEDVNDALKKIDDNLGDVAKSGDDDLGKLEKSLKDLNKTALKTGDDLDKSIGKKTKSATKEAKSGVEDFKDEVNQTARETAASFDGSAQSIIDLFQEVAAVAFIGFGPQAALAGLAVAGGIGLASSAFEAMTQDSQRVQGKIKELADELIRTGGDVSFSFQADQLKQLSGATDDQGQSLADLKKIADRAGMSYGDLIKAYQGTSDQYDELLKDAYDRDVAINKEITNNQALTTLELNNLGDRIVGLRQYTDAVVEGQKIQQKAMAEAEAAAAAGVSAMEARAAVQDQVNQAYDDAAGKVEAYISVESGLFDTAAYITAMQEREKALADYQAALATSGLTEEAKAFLASQGEDIAATMLSGYSSGDAKTKAELSRIWTEAGKKASGDASKEIDAGLKDDKTVKVTADTGLASEAIKTWNPGTKTIDILVTWKDKRTGQVIP